jgi:ankyrin repeat protein
VFHYASISHNCEVLDFLMSPALFPGPPSLLPDVLRKKTKRGENTAVYAIRQRCPPAFLDRIIAAAGPSILETTTIEGLGPLHCAAIADAPDLVKLLVQKYHLDPTEPFTRAPRADDQPSLFPEPVVGDTPIHLAARHNSAAAFAVLHEELGVSTDWPRNSAGEAPDEVAIKVNAKVVLRYFGLPILSNFRPARKLWWYGDEQRARLGKRRAAEMN